MSDELARMRRGAEPEPAWVDDVLSFWFGELDREAWFRRSEAIDALIRARFGKVHDKIAALPIDAALASPRRALATVVVLDQFSRNLFRGTPRAFDSDPKAREIARSAIARSFDHGLDVHGRSFLYMPFEHSEDLADQELAVSLLGSLGDEEYTRFAIAHRDIIARFGRFPHRNAVLGRASTPEEAEFLRHPGSSF
jgi:uncharacterized protein (DUF924 family)